MLSLSVKDLRALLDLPKPDNNGDTAEPVDDGGWRVRFWTCPAETRLGVRELAEALGRSPDFVYRHTSAKNPRRLPFRRLGGELVFRAGELRAWVREHERVEVRGLGEGWRT